MVVLRQCETPKWSPVEPFSALGRVPVRSLSRLFIRFQKRNSLKFAGCGVGAACIAVLGVSAFDLAATFRPR
jgi:hypothetical protein